MTQQPGGRPQPGILVLGRDTCDDTIRSRAHLVERELVFRYLKVDEDAAADAWIRRLNGGVCVTPTILIGDPENPSRIIREPSDKELDAAIDEVAGG
jgi:glutaredoxin